MNSFVAVGAVAVAGATGSLVVPPGVSVAPPGVSGAAPGVCGATAGVCGATAGVRGATVGPVGHQPGSAGLGDPYFPLAGNGGYDVVSYQLDLGYDPATDRLDGTVRIEATASQRLSRFDLDLQGLEVAAVDVDGRPARFVRAGQELVVTPAASIRQGRRFEVSVRYGGVPEPLGGPIVFGMPYGWLATDDGAFVSAEPDAASTWFPSNDHPSDKATYQFRLTVPDGLVAVANGALTSRHSEGGRTTFVWDARQPMATYAAVVAVGEFDLREGVTPSGVPNIVAIDPKFNPEATAPDLYQTTAEVLEYLGELLGPYPFDTTGGILEAPSRALQGYSLETQTRPIYTVLTEPVIAHELAHQWFGTSVTPRTWRDIWLSEGFATYLQWQWSERTGDVSPRELLRYYYDVPADDEFWQLPIGDPGRDDLFAHQVYVRGAMTLQVLRERVGDAAFFDLLRTFFDTYRNGNASIEDFLAMANTVTGQDVTGLLWDWLYTRGKPALP